MKNSYGKALLATALTIGLSTNVSAIPVDLELSLVIDVSGSISTSEYNLQMDGYANAFRDAGVQQNIINSTDGIAVNALFFASNYYTSSLDSFTILKTAADANAFANVLDNFARVGGGGTNIYTGVNRATDLLLANGLEGKMVMDVSGDGTDSVALNHAARDNAVSNGITVNGLAIGSDTIFNFYKDNVIGGTGAFAIQANTFADFEAAVIQKVRTETKTVSEPATLALLGLGLAGFGAARRNKKSA